jgi:beta-fructofuranosidase
VSGSSRPGFHVTAPTGWINDPLGVTWHGTGSDGRYELFVQYNPAGTEWAPSCHWGQLRSADLVRWEWAGVALSPGPGEDGCWSGSVVVRDDGVPVIVYTSVTAEHLDAGRIALAIGEPGWERWTPDPGGPVVGPPPEPATTHFRDPFVWRSGDGWRMAVGGGVPDGRAVALQYSSADLLRWDLDGVLADRPAEEDQPLRTGSVWECLQLFPLGERWVLLVSVWEDGEPRRMAAAVGAYDGRRFTPGSWQRFTATDALYAATTFVDAEGRRCALCWLREPGAAGDGWAGMLSLPVVLTLDGDRLIPAAHPAVDSLRGALLVSLPATALTAEPVLFGPLDPFLDVVLAVDPAGGGPVRIAVQGQDDDVLALLVDPAAGAVVLSRPGRDDERIPLSGTDEISVRLLLDAGIAEVFTAVDAGAVRVGSGRGPVSLEVSAPVGRAALHRLAAFGMPRG